MLYEKDEDVLRGLYKSASFVVQAIAFKQTGNYMKLQKDLLPMVSDDERAIVKTFIRMKNNEPIDFHSISDALFAWSKKWITEADGY